jgi:tRNA(Ile)-lysidine synthase
MKEITHLINAKLTALIRQHQLFSPHEKIVIGVSGGTDSLALAHILADLHLKLQIQIHIATFNHGLRPEAEAEIQFVQKIAQRLSIPCTVGHGNVLALYHSEKLTLEEAARKARYNFLSEVARRIGATTIVTGHHQDDQAETILFHLARGAGGAGAIGMKWISPVPYHPELRLVRPLLTTTRVELERYCQQNGLIPAQDPSNADVTITRNAIRNQIMPLLQAINPQVSGALARFAQIHADEQDALQMVFMQTILPHIRAEKGRFFISRAEFIGWHVAYQRRAITYFIPSSNMTYDHIAHALEVAKTGQNGAIAQFPQGWQLRVIYDELVLENIANPAELPQNIPLLPQNTTMPIELGRLYDFGGWQFSLNQNNEISSSHILIIPNGTQIFLRTRLPKDRFAPMGMNGAHQTIKDWMVNRKIPQALRAHIPLLVVDDVVVMILWERFFVAHSSFPRDENMPKYQVFISLSTNNG